MNTNEIITIALDNMETVKRDSGEWYTRTKQGAPLWMTDMIRACHGDMFPDDFRYKTIYDLLGVTGDLESIMSEDLEDISHELVDGQVDVYTSDLTKWLNSRDDRVYYLTEAIEEYDLKDGFKALMTAQYMEIEEIFNLLTQWILDFADEEEDQE